MHICKFYTEKIVFAQQKEIFCQEKIVFARQKEIFCQEKIVFAQQKEIFCQEKIVFAQQKAVLCSEKWQFIAFFSTKAGGKITQYLQKSNIFCTFACNNQNPSVMQIQTTEILRSSQSWDGAALPDYPSERPELVAKRMIFPVGAKTGWHSHTVINYGIVEQGELTIVCEGGLEQTFSQGQAIVEVVGTVHRGENRGTKPVILNMFYVSAPGLEVTIQHPEVG